MDVNNDYWTEVSFSFEKQIDYYSSLFNDVPYFLIIYASIYLIV